MNRSPVEQALRDRLGLDPAAVGESAVGVAVAARMRATGALTPDAYLPRLADPTEVDALADELVVPETWFFRGGRRLFDALAAHLARASDRAPDRVARALSVPCSTGEEPFSLAIALSETGLASDRFRIDAVDISAAHLARATAAQYSASAFRESGPDPRPPHFRATGGRWELLPPLRRAVHFHRGNLTDPGFLAGEPPYDVILCRNLFIYLTPDGRERATAHLERLLGAAGWLCLSPAEAVRLPPGRFVTVGPSEWCVYQKAGVPSALPQPSATPPAAGARRAPPVSAPGPDRPPAPAAATDPLRAALTAARELADAGRLADAERACAGVLADHPDSADGYALLGVILLAGGKAEAAAAAFRKGLYLDPDHPEALAHLAVLAEQRQDVAQAVALRRRLARRAARETPT